jgi:hypothetical protein
MRLVAIYRQKSDHARIVYEFIETLRRRYPDKHVEELEIDSREGAAEAILYGVVQYPALIATSMDGRVLGVWEGVPLPMIDEVAGMLLVQQPTTV